MKMKIILILVIMLFLKPSLFAAEVDKWQIIPGIRVGEINAKTSEADLSKIFGKQYIKSEIIERGEWEPVLGTIVFPSEPEKKLVIIWHDEAVRDRPKFIIISGKRSKWKTKSGISLGTTLKQIEKINGKPFSFFGFGRDGAGTIYDFASGKLCSLNYCDKDENGIIKPKKIYITIASTLQFGDKAFIGVDKELGGADIFSSHQAAWQKLDLRVNEILVILDE